MTSWCCLWEWAWLADALRLPPRRGPGGERRLPVPVNGSARCSRFGGVGSGSPQASAAAVTVRGVNARLEMEVLRSR